MVKCTGRGLAVKRPGVLSKVQMLNLVLGVGGVFSLLPNSFRHFFANLLLPDSFCGSVREQIAERNCKCICLCIILRVHPQKNAIA